MKKLFSFAALALLLGANLSPALLYAQSNDDLVNDLLSSSAGWGFASGDKQLVKVVAKTDTSATIEAPVAKRDGKTVTAYYITWAPISYNEIVSTVNADDLAKVKDSDTIEASTGSPMYTIQGDKIVFTIDIAEPNKDIYVTIAPEDETRTTGNTIEDFTFNLSTVQIGTTGTAVAGDVYETSNNDALVNVSCVWDASANRTTLLWDLNTAFPTQKVEISHRGDEQQGAMTIKGTPSATERRFVVDTPHRNVQLFKLKPLDASGAMLGNEIQYICKAAPTPTAPITPTNPDKPIPVTPATGPVETTAIVLIVSLVGYGLYRRIKKA